MCEVPICFHHHFHFFQFLFTNHVSRNEERDIYRKQIGTSHIPMPIIQYVREKDFFFAD